jgi:quercetin dioxygenase-like cupin family protein
MIETLLRPGISQKPTLENSIHYMAHTFSFLATGEDTDGAYSLIHCYFRKNFFPPPHLHKYEDESFFILEGEFNFLVGGKKIIAGPGELVVLPKNVPHSFNLVTETAKALVLITPAGFETIFKEFGKPAVTLDLPPVPGNMPNERYQHMNERIKELGNVWMPEV